MQPILPLINMNRASSAHQYDTKHQDDSKTLSVPYQQLPEAQEISRDLESGRPSSDSSCFLALSGPNMSKGYKITGYILSSLGAAFFISAFFPFAISSNPSELEIGVDLMFAGLASMGAGFYCILIRDCTEDPLCCRIPLD